MKPAILSAFAVAATLAAAPLAAKDVTPVQPKASTQGEAVLGALTGTQIAVAVAVAVVGAAAISSGSDSSNNTPNE